MSERNLETIRRLYAALDACDGETMAACYAADATFSDPVFPDLREGRVREMWRMLTARADDLAVELAEHDAEADIGHARWVARYTFARTGRPVVNNVRAELRFDAAGLIVDHRDHFDFWRWSRQALGPAGVALGWTPFLRSKVRGEAAAELERFAARRGGPTPTGE